MEPTLVVVGLNHRTAAVEVRERFWMSGCRQAEVLSMLSQGEGIEEVLVFSTCNRTEFMVWGDATLAVNSILRLLTAEYDLKLQEWNSFYRRSTNKPLPTLSARAAASIPCALASNRSFARWREPGSWHAMPAAPAGSWMQFFANLCRFGVASTS